MLLLGCAGGAPAGTVAEARIPSQEVSADDTFGVGEAAPAVEVVPETVPEAAAEPVEDAGAAADIAGEVAPEVAEVDGVAAAPPELPPDRHAAFIWRGFDHEWLRTVLGFRVPHRISVLSSFVDKETHSGEAAGSWKGEAELHFGQSTGVDGNYMHPIGRFGAFYAPAVTVTRRTVSFAWTDEVGGGEYPQAKSDREELLSLPLAELGLGTQPPGAYVALLSGFALTSSCDDKKQPADAPCNSDGFWPFRIAMRAHPCGIAGETVTCPVSLEIYRAWTPNQGGDPLGLEVKPLNDKLDFEATVDVTLVAGLGGDLVVTPSPEITASGMARDDEAAAGTLTLDGQPGMAQGTVGLTAWAFEFLPTGTSDDNKHLGRYIGRLDFGVSDQGYQAATGAQKLGWVARVWVPDTVVDAKVTYALRAVALQFGEGAVAGDQTVQGQLCSNSTEQAPFFSKWEKCGTDPTYGPEQDESWEPISAP